MIRKSFQITDYTKCNFMILFISDNNQAFTDGHVGKNSLKNKLFNMCKKRGKKSSKYIYGVAVSLLYCVKSSKLVTWLPLVILFQLYL